MVANPGFLGASKPGPGLAGLHAWAEAIYVLLNRMLTGKLNCTGTVTLAANVATTTLTDVRIGGLSKLFFTATTANAAAEIGNGTMFLNAPSDGSVVLNHANNAQTDRTFWYAVIG